LPNPTDTFLNQGVTGAAAIIFLTGLLFLFRENRQIHDSIAMRLKEKDNEAREREKEIQKKHAEELDKYSEDVKYLREQISQIQSKHQNEVVAKQDAMIRMVETHRNELIAMQDQSQKEAAMLQEARMEDAKNLAQQTFTIVQSLTNAIDLVSFMYEKPEKQTPTKKVPR